MEVGSNGAKFTRKDGAARSANIRTGSEQYTRPVVKISRLLFLTRDPTV